MILLVDLDTQKGKPSEHEALRVAGNLLTADGEFAPTEMIKKVGIGTRVRMIFKKVSDGFALPHWTIDEEAEQPANPWRYPQGLDNGEGDSLWIRITKRPRPRFIRV
jgi:hypothetical protein